MNQNKKRRLYLYRSGFDPVEVDEGEMQGFIDEGWLESPLSYLHLPDHGIDPDDQEMVQVFGESVEGIVKNVNGLLNLDLMTHNELICFADNHYSTKFQVDESISRDDILQMIKSEESHIWPQEPTLSQQH